eukprot:3827272-Pyramimonas_sp.AAC.1
MQAVLDCADANYFNDDLLADGLRLFCELPSSDVERTVVYGGTSVLPTEEEGERHTSSPISLLSVYEQRAPSVVNASAGKQRAHRGRSVGGNAKVGFDHIRGCRGSVEGV